VGNEVNGKKKKVKMGDDCRELMGMDMSKKGTLR
jgi:hypothetical protein